MQNVNENGLKEEDIFPLAATAAENLSEIVVKQ